MKIVLFIGNSKYYTQSFNITYTHKNERFPNGNLCFLMMSHIDLCSIRDSNDVNVVTFRL